MDLLTWEWTLVTGEKIIARVDPNTLVESIYVGQRLVSRSGEGGKQGGHTVQLSAASAPGAYRGAGPQELRLTFDSALCSFQLRANGQVVPPSLAPGAVPPEARAGGVHGFLPPTRSFIPAAPLPEQGGSGCAKVAGIVVVCLAACAIAGVLGVRKYVAGARAAAVPPAGSMRASTGLLTAHYPAGFTAAEERKYSAAPAGRDDDCGGRQCNIEQSLLKIKHASRDEGVMIASFKMNGLRIGLDPWRVSNLLHEKFADLSEIQGSQYVEVGRQDATCLGEAGAVVTGRFTHGADSGTVWSCTFIRDGNAFWVTTYVNVKEVADNGELDKIVNATEIIPRR